MYEDDQDYVKKIQPLYDFLNLSNEIKIIFTYYISITVTRIIYIFFLLLYFKYVNIYYILYMY